MLIFCFSIWCISSWILQSSLLVLIFNAVIFVVFLGFNETVGTLCGSGDPHLWFDGSPIKVHSHIGLDITGLPNNGPTADFQRGF